MENKAVGFRPKAAGEERSNADEENPEKGSPSSFPHFALLSFPYSLKPAVYSLLSFIIHRFPCLHLLATGFFTFYVLRFTPMSSPLPIGVLISGSGTNLQAIIDAIERQELAATIRVVISNRADAYGLTRAQKYGLATVVVNHKEFSSREAFEAELLKVLQTHGVELVVLAGFMRVLTSFFIRSFSQCIMNIHPALLPAFAGTHGQRQALQYGVKIAGATVHFVDEQTDHGPIITQAAVPVYPDDTEESLSARILAQEHRILPHAIQLFAEGRLEIRERIVVVHNAPRLPDASLRVPESQ